VPVQYILYSYMRPAPAAQNVCSEVAAAESTALSCDCRVMHAATCIRVQLASVTALSLGYLFDLPRFSHGQGLELALPFLQLTSPTLRGKTMPQPTSRFTYCSVPCSACEGGLLEK
jgi:hypothetical protein